MKPLSGRAAAQADGVDLRGDTDESFDRGNRFPVGNDVEADKSLGRD
ncbi:hypothetical protein MKK75_32670 [Methylobacterium sp. J-030]|nr:hypothetical protein [Methylobacterium sp. J-030]MCJ2073487.1 hypothetical protein [Methylobacterium sp. J-030]